ncbi:hypothetical protein CBR_g53548 [Chara braunii]|uniref:Presequence protease mitochondrial-type C-terminal domain-containing protein n=1 Tax=Chara braunii TaxID=69332 RepID=A0A388MB58_CHABU|nr:hypothetical protein CBR_g53548 [Chara braunii]|eukprot:GBG91733.1 hypothetical protein CBR_g53548 [Chara braunii]
MRVFTLQIDLDAQSTFASLSASSYWIAPWDDYLRTQLTLRLLSKDSVRGWFEDSTNGHGAYLKIQEVKRVAATSVLEWRQILIRLREIYGLVVRAGGASISLVGDNATISSASESVKMFAESLPQPAAPEQRQTWTELCAPVNESASMPLLVYSNSRSRNVYKGGWQASGSVYVINEVQTAWINTIVRSQRHAYGGGTDFYASTGLVAHVSWADPRIRASLRAFDESAQYLTNLTENSENITRIVAATLGKRMEPLTPYEEGFKRFKDFLFNVTASDYQELYNEVKSTSLLDFQAYGAALAKSSGFTVIAVPPFIRDDEASAEPSLNFTKLETPYRFRYDGR